MSKQSKKYNEENKSKTERKKFLIHKPNQTDNLVFPLSEPEALVETVNRLNY